MPFDNTIRWYDANAGELARRYEAAPSDEIHGWLADLLPDAPGVVIDIGAGTGRDAAWFASKGFEVVAVEPSSGMRAQADRLHPNPRIRWVRDGMPALSATLRLGIAADVVFLSAVWMHLPEVDRPRAFRKLVSLAKSGGLIAISIRNGEPDAERGLHAASVAEVERLARDHGLLVARVAHAEDGLSRGDVSWDYVALRLPDDGTNALPLLRHIVLNDNKTSTYKLGLLRTICRAADGSAGMAREAGEEHVAVPMGLVALNWLRLYVPLLKADLPQISKNEVAGGGLGFVREPAKRIISGSIPVNDLRIGARFVGRDAGAMHEALRDAAQNIRKNPATYTTYPNGGKVFGYEPERARAVAKDGIVLDAAYLKTFGWLLIPRNMWLALQRFGAWIEPSVVAEWIRLMKGYAAGQGRALDDARIAAAMAWSDPERDVALPRKIALDMLQRGRQMHCVWSGLRLDADVLDIDHCFPWAAWPCGDLWNLMPAHPRINQQAKRDKLPSDRLLGAVQDRIVGWWEAAYLSPERPLLAPQFTSEARASLPALSGDALTLDDVHSAMRFQRLRLWRDQQVTEWDGI